MLASLVSLLRTGQLRWKTARDAVFILGLAVVFVIQFYEGIGGPEIGLVRELSAYVREGRDNSE